MSNFMGVGIFWIGLNRADLGCWGLTLSTSDWLKMDFSSLFPNQSNFSHFFFIFSLTACTLLYIAHVTELVIINWTTLLVILK